MSKKNTKKLDFIKFRKDEIAYAIAKEKSKETKIEIKSNQNSLPWYKRQIFFQILGSVIAFSIIITLLLISFLVANAG